MTPENEKAWAVLCHLGTLAGGLLPFGQLLIPLSIWLYYRKKSSFIDAHGRSSLEFQVSLTVYFAFLGSAFWGLGKALGGSQPLTVVAAGSMTLLALAALLLVIRASMSAYRGEPYRYPIAFPLLSGRGA